MPISDPIILGDYTTLDGVKVGAGDWLYHKEGPPAIIKRILPEENGMVLVEGQGAWAGQTGKWWPSLCYAKEESWLLYLRNK